MTPEERFALNWDATVRQEIVLFLRKSFRPFPLNWVAGSPPHIAYQKVLHEIEHGQAETPLARTASDVGDAMLGAMIGSALAPLLERAVRAIEKWPPPKPPPPPKKRKKASHLRRVK